MLRRIFPALASIVLFGSCTSLKQLGTALNKQPASATSLTTPQNQPSVNSNAEVKFLDDITASAHPTTIQAASIQVNSMDVNGTNLKKQIPGISISETVDTKEAATPLPLQFKYAQLLQASPNEIQNLELFEFIDYWYGTRYCMGGTTQKCIDCSALVQLMYSDIYRTTLPRTSKEQHKNTRRISLTELQEGDLLFFHTRGRGVSHVGVYLRNNKFVHASSSGGVMISDMYEPYFVKRLISAGRVEK